MGSILKPTDQSARNRFASELDCNFSVVASAGSGKTTAITKRVLSIARSPKAAEILPRLVVVTFTNRAADEMQQRTRQILLEQSLGGEIQTAFNRAFFGTIHSFCMKLLTDYGHYLGLPSPLELLSDDDDDIWQEFVQGQTRTGHSLGEENRARLLRLVQVRDLMELARRARSETLRPAGLSPCPPLEFAQIYAQSDKGKYNTIHRSKAELREWEKRYAGDWEFLRWPTCFSLSGKFLELWQEEFSPLRKWICNLAICVAAEVQRDFLDFRLERGLVTYGDQIALAKELLRHPVAAPRIREGNFRVILDEAQDTEPAQFSVLLETTRPPHATANWMETRTDPPRPGHFCMVGDFQQSIYRERADLPYYRAVHNALVADGNGESLDFPVTFRLDQKQLDFVNETFREILNDPNGHVQFVELHPRPDILPGKVIRVPLVAKELLPEGKKLKDYQVARFEAEFLARWIKNAGLKKLCADSWREVAILCPRKAWLQTMATALRRVQLAVAIQSERDVKGDSPAYAWLTALLTIVTDPRNAYEIVGVLREIFGVSDHDLAVFSEGQSFRFRIDEEFSATGKISSHLRLLAQIRQRVAGLALFDAVTLIVDETQLRGRLLLLPAEEFGDLAHELDALLAQAAEAEASGMILAEFAEHLCNDFTTPRSVRFATDNAIQLITSHKAKGSEWQCVILPFLARELRPPSPPYPHFMKSPITSELELALGKEDKPKELKDAIERAQAQELERLLYVATTRARRTLVLALDQQIFSNSEGKLPKTAQLRRLIRDKDFYSDEFGQCTSTIADAEESKAIELSPENIHSKIEPLTSRELKRAVQRASEFVTKITPSAFDAELLEAVRTRSRLENPATLYGHWWHRLLQRLPWNDESAWEEILEAAVHNTPDRKRAEKEWKLFRDYLSKKEDFRSRFARNEFAIRTEVPFLLKIKPSLALEGIIDLAMIDAKAKRALIIDWKTNRIGRGEVDALSERYRPQIAAYWKAMIEITGFAVEAGLYSTATGAAFFYKTDELEREWQRLEKLPPDRAAEETSIP